MSDLPRTTFTAAEYLALEAVSERKNEFAFGEIFAMAGGRHRHNALSGRFLVALHGLLAGKPCYPVGSDQRVRAADGSAYFYPDASVFCRGPGGEVPTVIVEVTSPSTARYDATVKRHLYQAIPTVDHILIADPNAVRVEHWFRFDGAWRCDVVEDVRGGLRMLGGELLLAPLYVGLSEIADEE